MKKEFTVVVEEVLARSVTVEASNEEEALHLVEEMYRNCDIVLDGDDFVGEADFNIYED